MAIYKEDIVNIELSTGKIFRSFLPTTIGAGDDIANRFGVRAFRDGVAESIGGSCFGLFIRADGTTVAISNGVVSGNLAYVTLPEACYAVEGQFALAIKCQGGGVTGTLRIVDGVVSRTSTSATVDPGTVIPSIEDLIEAIDDAVASIPADYSGLWTSLAPEFSTGSAYTKGQYVTYNGKMYRFTINHAAGSWNAEQVTPVTVGEEASGLNNAMEDIAKDNVLFIKPKAVFTTVQGTWQYETVNVPIAAGTGRQITINYSSVVCDGGTLPNNIIGVAQKTGATVIGNVGYVSKSDSVPVTVPISDETDNIDFRFYTNNGSPAINTAITYTNLIIIDGTAKKVELQDNYFNGKKLSQYLAESLTYKGAVSGTLLSAYTDCGFYNVTTAVGANLEDCPTYADDKTGSLIVIRPAFNSSSFCMQIFSDSVGRMWHRVIQDSVSVGPWRKIADPERNLGKYYAFGDSLTSGVISDGAGVAPVKWVDIVAEVKGLSLTNYGEGGTGYIAKSNGRNAVSYADYRSYSDARLITLAYGINDYLTSQTIGTISDDKTSNTFIGNLKYCIQKLQGDAPLAKIFVMSPMMCSKYGTYPDYALTYSLNGKTLQDYIDAIKTVCELMHVTFIDMTEKGFINSENVTAILQDDLHPISNAYPYIGYNIAGLLQFEMPFGT